MQIIIRILGAGIPVFDFVAGEVVDGQFRVFDDMRERISSFLRVDDFVTFDTLLGGRAYVRSENLAKLISALAVFPGIGSMEFYPNFFVLNIKKEDE